MWVRTGWEMVGKAWSAVCRTPAMERSCTRGAVSASAVRQLAVSSAPCCAAHACDRDTATQHKCESSHRTEESHVVARVPELSTDWHLSLPAHVEKRPGDKKVGWGWG